MDDEPGDQKGPGHGRRLHRQCNCEDRGESAEPHQPPEGRPRQGSRLPGAVQADHDRNEEVANQAWSDVLQDLEDAVATVAEQEGDGPHHEARERRPEPRARPQGCDDVERREEDELVAWRERDVREELERLDAEHREREARDHRDVLRVLRVAAGARRAVLGVVVVILDAVDVLLRARDVAVHPVDDGADIAAGDAPEARSEAAECCDEPAPAAVDPEATMVFSAPPAADAAEQPPSGLDFDLGLDADEASPEAESVKAEGLNIDFDLDLGGDAPPDAAAEAVVDLGSDISFDLDPPSAAVPAAPEVSAHASDISFDLDMPKAGGVEMDLPAVDMPKAAAGASDVDFDFDLGTVKLNAPLIQPAAAPAPLDLGGISLELDSPSPVTASGGADNAEAATKLELALAYEEMGDRDGARELLAEVLKEGSATQQAAAQARLNQLG